MDSQIESSSPNSNKLIYGLLVALLVLTGITIYLFTRSENIPKIANQNITHEVVCKRFTDLSEALENIQIACVLDLSGKLNGSVSPDIAKLTNLNELNLSSNNLTQFPTAVLQLKKLKSLNLSHNQLESVPSEIGNMVSLQTIDLRNNSVLLFSQQEKIKQFFISTQGRINQPPQISF